MATLLILLNGNPLERCWQWLCVAFGTWLLGAIPLGAQPADRFERLDSHRGLAHNSIGALLEDHRGFLWIGTFDGLSRYDGVDFTTWRHHSDDPHSLSGNIVHTLLEDHRGDLWVGTSRGLDFMKRSGWDAHHFDRLPIPSRSGPLASVPVWALLRDRQNAIWAGLGNGLLRHTSEGSIEVFRHDPGDPRSLPAGAVHDLTEDASGSLWVLSSPSLELGFRKATLSRYDPTSGGFEHVALPEPWDVGGILVDARGVFWLNVSGLATFDPETRVFEYPLLEESHVPLRDLKMDRAGDLWITTNGGFRRYRPSTGGFSGSLPSLASEDRLASFATVFLEGQDGTRWLGTRAGLFQVDPHQKPFLHRHRRVDDTGSLSSDRISAVLFDHRGSAWVGTYGAGLNQLPSLTGPALVYRHTADDPESLCHDTIWHLAEGKNGDLWIGVEDGLCRYLRSTGQFQRFRLGAPGADPAGPSVRFIVVAPSGRLWLATEVGLLSIDPSSGEVNAHSSEDPAIRLIHSLHRDPPGVLWVGTRKGLKAFDTHEEAWSDYPLVTPEGRLLVSEGIFDIRPDGDGLLWLASSDGLSRFDPRMGLVEHYDAGDGLPGSSVFSFLEAEDGRIWLGTNQGLSRFDPEGTPGGQFHNYGPGDGIGNLEFNRHAADRTEDGTFVIGGMEGLTIFQPSEIRDNPVAPRLALSEVRIDGPEGGRSFTPGADSALVLGHDEASFTVGLAALGFGNAHRHRYQVWLEGFDDRWIDNGHRRFARYHRLPPGRYRLHARAGNSDGKWSTDQVLLKVRVLPAFWQAIWFRGLISALGVGLLIGVHRMRVSRLLEIERLRLRIADDLHDDLSSELSGIALTMEVLQRQGIDAVYQDRVARVRDRALVMLDRLRDIVWCIDPEHDTQEALVRKLRITADTLLANHTYDFTTELDRGSFPLPVRRGVLLVFKEALHNIVRHARANRIRIRLVRSGGILTLHVLDNGCGFDRSDMRLGGGLASMQRRVEAMAGRLSILPRPSGGTEICLEVPIHPKSAESPRLPRFFGKAWLEIRNPSEDGSIPERRHE